MPFELQQTTDMFYVREIFETFLSPLFLMFLFLIYLQPSLFRVVIRETATEKEFDTPIQMTLEHFSSDISENKNRAIKKLLTNSCKCYKTSNFL